MVVGQQLFLPIPHTAEHARVFNGSVNRCQTPLLVGGLQGEQKDKVFKFNKPDPSLSRKSRKAPILIRQSAGFRLGTLIPIFH